MRKLASTAFLSLLVSILILLTSLFAIQLNVNERYAEQHQGKHGERANSEIAEVGVFGIGAEGWTAIFTGGLVVVTAGLFFYTYRLFRVASQEIEESGRSFLLEQRPWLSIEAMAQSGLKWTEGGCAVDLIFRVTNVGKSPAKNFRHDFELISGEGQRLIDRQAILASSFAPIVIGETQTSTIFPTTSVPIIRSLNATFFAPEDRRVIVCLIGAVSYQSVYNDNLLETGIILMAADGERLTYRRSDGDIPLGRLRWSIFADGRTT